jgi:hypothetical protein
VNPVKSIRGVAAIELQNGANVIKEFFAVLSWFVRIFTREERFDANVRAMKQVDQASEAVVGRGVTVREDRDVDFVDVVGAAEIAE